MPDGSIEMTWAHVGGNTDAFTFSLTCEGCTSAAGWVAVGINSEGTMVGTNAVLWLFDENSVQEVQVTGKSPMLITGASTAGNLLNVATDAATKTLVFTAATIGTVDIAKSGDQTWLFAYGDGDGFTQHASDARGVAELNFDARIASSGQSGTAGASAGGAAGASAGVLGVVILGVVILGVLSVGVLSVVVVFSVHIVRSAGAEPQADGNAQGDVVGAVSGSAAAREGLNSKGSLFSVTSPQETRNPVQAALEAAPPPLPERPERIRLRPYSVALPFSAASDLRPAAEPQGTEL